MCAVDVFACVYPSEESGEGEAGLSRVEVERLYQERPNMLVAKPICLIGRLWSASTAGGGFWLAGIDGQADHFYRGDLGM